MCRPDLLGIPVAESGRIRGWCLACFTCPVCIPRSVDEGGRRMATYAAASALPCHGGLLSNARMQVSVNVVRSRPLSASKETPRRAVDEARRQRGNLNEATCRPGERHRHALSRHAGANARRPNLTTSPTASEGSIISKWTASAHERVTRSLMMLMQPYRPSRGPGLLSGSPVRGDPSNAPVSAGQGRPHDSLCYSSRMYCTDTIRNICRQSSSRCVKEKSATWDRGPISTEQRWP